MSWQPYIDQHLIGTGCVAKAAICGFDGSSWAGTADFSVSAPEIESIVRAFNDPSDFQLKGAMIAGEKYRMLSVEGDVMRLKLKGTGIIITKTTRALVIGYYGEGIQAGACSNVVERLGDYLRGVGY